MAECRGRDDEVYDELYVDIVDSALSDYREPRMNIIRNPIQTNCGSGCGCSGRSLAARVDLLERRVAYLYSVIFPRGGG